MLAGSPVSPEVYAWFYRNVKRDLWLHVGSMGVPVGRAANTRAMAEPAALVAFIDYALTRQDYTI